MTKAKPEIGITLRPDGPAAKDIIARLPDGASLTVGRCERTMSRPGSMRGWRAIMWGVAGVPGRYATAWSVSASGLSEYLERLLEERGPWWTVPGDEAATAAGEGNQ
jgi:hypothetical protein